MRTIDEPMVKKLVQDFSHALGNGFDGVMQKGSQRETFQTLGLGWIYFSLARALELKKILVVGSGRGFSVACFGLGMEPAGTQIIFVDPGYDSWSVDGMATDTAAGLWKDPVMTAAHFSSQLGLDNVEHLKLRSDEAFAHLQHRKERFDLVYIDGEHSYRQSLSDFRSAWTLLAPNGIIVAHDARCRDWPGVALAIAHFETEQTDAQTFMLPLYPGLGFIQRRNPLLTIRRATAEENSQINEWRRNEKMTLRPLDDLDDPRPGFEYDDPRIGLFSVIEDGELIGGFGLKYRMFTENGSDNFTPYKDEGLSGFLCYGAIIREDKRGRGLWMHVIMELLRWCNADGFFQITANSMSDEDKPWLYRTVGRTPTYLAYHVTLRKRDGDSWTETDKKSASTLDLQNRLSELRIANATIQQAVEQSRRELKDAMQKVSIIKSSRAWRTMAFLRRMVLFIKGHYFKKIDFG
jgi:hypothetical protein